MKLFFIQLIIFGSQSLFAESNPGMEKYFADKINGVQSAVQTGAILKDENPNFCWQDINFNLSASVSFGISGFLSLTVAPEIDFILTPVTSVPGPGIQ